MAVWTSYGDGQYRASEAHVAYLPRLWKSGGRLCLQALHHAGTVDLLLTDTYDDEPRAIAERGTAVIAGDNGATSSTRWGNSDSDTSVDALRSYAGTAFGATTTTVAALGTSMGAATILNWARTHLSSVTRIALVVPAVDIEDIRANNRQSAQASIETAYTNNATWQATRSTRNPVEYAAELAAIPIRIWHSTDDPVCVPSTITAFAAAHGNTTVSSLGAVGHDGTSLDEHAMADWLTAA